MIHNHINLVQELVVMDGLLLENNVVRPEDNEEQQHEEFEIFFRLTYERLCSFALVYVNNRNEAEDIVQAVFLNVWDQKNLWDDFESAKAYMFQSVRNEALNYKKHEKVKRKFQSEIQLRRVGKESR